jgi:outer membrane protein TolC
VTNSWVGLTIEQPLVVPEGWYGRRAAVAGADAGRLAEGRARQLSSLDAVAKYFAAVLAGARVRTLDTALVAARATLDRVRALRREGVVTGIDELLARNRSSALEAERATAEADRAAKIDRLLLSLGEEPGQPVELLDSLALPVAPPDSGERLDLAASRAVLAARAANLARTRWQRLPSLGAFGSVGWNQGTVGIGGPGHWTAGLMIRWTPFRGLEDVAAVERARSEADLAESELSALQRSAAADVRAAAARLRAAAVGLAAADRALESGAEALRVATTRYAGGVATISELLAVESAVAEQRLARLQALFDARIAQAELAVAQGGDPR